MGALQLKCSLFIFALLSGFLAIDACARAQNGPTTVQTSGITVAIAKVGIARNQIIIQFTISNNTKVRVYLKDARTEASQGGQLSSGNELQPPFPQLSGIESCNSGVTTCLNHPDAKDLNTYSYIDPGQLTVMGFKFNAQIPPTENDMISFAIALITRFAHPNDETQTDAARTLRFNFPFVSLKQR